MSLLLQQLWLKVFDWSPLWRPLLLQVLESMASSSKDAARDLLRATRAETAEIRKEIARLREHTQTDQAEADSIRRSMDEQRRESRRESQRSGTPLPRPSSRRHLQSQSSRASETQAPGSSQPALSRRRTVQFAYGIRPSSPRVNDESPLDEGLSDAPSSGYEEPGVPKQPPGLPGTTHVPKAAAGAYVRPVRPKAPAPKSSGTPRICAACEVRPAVGYMAFCCDICRMVATEPSSLRCGYQNRHGKKCTWGLLSYAEHNITRSHSVSREIAQQEDPGVKEIK